VPDAEIQPILNALGNLNEEINKAREEQRQKAWEKDKNTIIYSYSSLNPVFVVINERIKLFQKD